ncbi:PKD domain-containing protein [Chitinophaga dinghuensis]|uniref:PKD domain-containing protein n=1 Tax=Chitinophaga dinghuensis TaxID=1539050 RepID=UPI001B87F756|nr:PKD domain-containing protein [Chitinophaga dinghuensis]
MGTAATFGSNQPADVSFAWQLSGKEDSIYNTPTVTYTFRSPGEKILTLIVNRDTARMAVKRIHIFPPPILTSTPAPTAPAPPPIPHLPIKKVEPAVPSITAEEFRFMLQQVIYGNKQFTDFSEYLCNNIQTPVIINEKTMMPFNQFCLQIRGKKRLSIDQVNITRDKSGCITALNIQYNKKKFIGLF